MADLVERGQLILVAGFAVAVILVALALVLNAAIFTGNLATSGENTAGTDALVYRQSVQSNTAEFLAYANDVNRSNWADMERNVSQAVANLTELQASQQVGTGRVVNYTVVEATDGTRIIQNDSSTFERNSTTTAQVNWTVADDIDSTREFRMNVSGGTDSLAPASNDPFRVAAVDTTVVAGLIVSVDVQWWMNVSSPAGSDQVTVTVSNDTAGGPYTCTRSFASGTEPFWINATEGTVAGTECDPLRFAENDDVIDEIRFASGEEITGNYSLVVDDTDEETDTSGIGADYPYYDDGTDPESEKVLYSVTVEMVYQTPDLTYRTDVRVAPGEPDE